MSSALVKIRFPIFLFFLYGLSIAHLDDLLTIFFFYLTLSYILSSPNVVSLNCLHYVFPDIFAFLEAIAYLSAIISMAHFSRNTLKLNGGGLKFMLCMVHTVRHAQE